MKIIDYLEDQLSFEDRMKFEEDLKTDQNLKQEFEEYRKLYGEFDDLDIEKPSQSLKSNFEQLLNEEIKQNRSTKILTMKNIRNAASIAAILVIGILVGQNWTQSNQLDTQNAILLAEMRENIKSTSVSGRIEAVQVSQKFVSNDPEIEVLNTLISTLTNDISPNVRLAAAEALDRFAEKENVRAVFVRQLSVETDPFVLIALINTLSDQKVEKAIDPLQNLTKAKDIAKFIKDEAHLGLIKIEKI